MDKNVIFVFVLLLSFGQMAYNDAAHNLNP